MGKLLLKKGVRSSALLLVAALLPFLGCYSTPRLTAPPRIPIHYPVRIAVLPLLDYSDLALLDTWPKDSSQKRELSEKWQETIEKVIQEGAMRSRHGYVQIVSQDCFPQFRIQPVLNRFRFDHAKTPECQTRENASTQTQKAIKAGCNLLTFVLEFRVLPQQSKGSDKEIYPSSNMPLEGFTAKIEHSVTWNNEKSKSNWHLWSGAIADWSQSFPAKKAAWEIFE